MRLLPVVVLSTFVLALVPAAHAAAPGDNLLVSGPAGLSPLDPALGAWNASGVADSADETPNDITPDGRFAVFASLADGLAPGEDPGFSHVFRKDLTTGELIVVDQGAVGSSAAPTISDDGRFVAFASAFPGPPGTAPEPDVWVKDLQTGVTTRITTNASQPGCALCLEPVISGNGAEVAFVTRDALVSGDTNDRKDVYARAVSGTTFQLISAQPNGTTAGNGFSDQPSITTAGDKIAYVSRATDIDPTDDPNAGADLYVRTLTGASSKLASAQNGNDFGIAAGVVTNGQISGDGTAAVFDDTTSYVADDTDTFSDVYRRTLASKSTKLESITANGTDADSPAFDPAIDETGARIAFTSSATNLGGGPGARVNVYVRDIAAQTITAVANGAGFANQPALGSGAGAKVVFRADDAMSDGPTPGAIHVAPVTGGTVALVSAPASGPPLVPGLTEVSFPPYSDDRRLSADGRFTVFSTFAPALGAPNGAEECYRRDLRTDALDLVSRGPSGLANDCALASISADGSRVGFVTTTPLVADDTHPSDSDAYVRDLSAGTTTLASRQDGAGGADSDGGVLDGEISGDGNVVAFTSTATNLGDGSGKLHAYARFLQTNQTRLEDRFAGSGDISDKPVNDFGSITVDGTGSRVAFDTQAKLVPEDTDLNFDVYVRDNKIQTTILASRQSASLGGAKGDKGSFGPALSVDGRRVAFQSLAQNLDPAFVPWPTDGTVQAFVRDFEAQTTTLVSRSASGTSAADAGIGDAALDGDGGLVAFEARAQGRTTNVSPEVTDGASFLVVRRLSDGNTRIVHPAGVEFGQSFFQGASNPALSADGRCLGFLGRGRGIVPNLSPDFDQMFVRVLDGDCGTVAPAGSGGAGAEAAAGNAGVAGAGGAGAAKAVDVRDARITNNRFRRGTKPTAIATAAARAPVGTTFRFTLSDPATMTIRLDRLTKGRRSGRRCVKPTRKLRRRRSCTRATPKGNLTRRNLAAGARQVPFTGRLGRKALPLGRYRATLVATAPGRPASKPVALSFQIVRR